MTAKLQRIQRPIQLLYLPLEILERILIFSGSSELPLVNTIFLVLGQPSWVKAYWLAHKYRDQVFSECWNVRFMSMPCSCSPSAPNSQSPTIPRLDDAPISNVCRAEEYQIDILSYIVRLKIGCIEDCMIAAATRGHLQIVDWLLKYGADGGVYLASKKRVKKRNSFLGYSRQYLSLKRRSYGTPASPVTEMYAMVSDPSGTKSVSLLQKAVEWNYIGLASVLLASQGSSQDSTNAFSPEILKKRLRQALDNGQIEMSRLLIHVGHAVASPGMVQRIMNKGAYYRLLWPSKSKMMNNVIGVALEGLSDEDMEARGPALVKMLAELGCVPGIQVCVDRGIDININEGIILSSCAYNGNLDLFEYLLQHPQVDLDLFTQSQRLFCISLISVETLAITMFTLLLVAWIMTLVETVHDAMSPQNRWSSPDGVSVWELSAISLPSVLAISLMYRLVPIHRLVKILRRIGREQKQRGSLAATTV